MVKYVFNAQELGRSLLTHDLAGPEFHGRVAGLYKEKLISGFAEDGLRILEDEEHGIGFFKACEIEKVLILGILEIHVVGPVADLGSKEDPHCVGTHFFAEGGAPGGVEGRFQLVCGVFSGLLGRERSGNRKRQRKKGQEFPHIWFFYAPNIGKPGLKWQGEGNLFWVAATRVYTVKNISMIDCILGCNRHVGLPSNYVCQNHCHFVLAC